MKKLLLILLCLSTFLLSNNLKAQCNIMSTPTSCCNWCDGTASVSVTGGNPGYSYLWTGPPGFTATTSTVNGLCEGTYPVIIIDAIGDTVCNDTVVIVLSPNALVYNLTITPPSAPGLCDGFLTANINGGTPPLSYLWFDSNMNTINGALGSILSGLCAGDTCCVFVTDLFGACCDTVCGIIPEIVLGIIDVSENKKKTILKITNVLGQPIKGKTNEPLFYIYDDGTVEKRITVE